LRWLADECVDAALVRWLRLEGHDVAYMAEIAAGSTDPEVLALAARDQRLLLTEDKDFGDLVFRTGHAVPGVVLMRLAPALGARKAERLGLAITRFGEGFFGRYIVVEETKFRSRPLLHRI
jgi:predicted nuclease of predicted toxin-antitoxin system